MIRRVGREKLGVTLTPVRRLASGAQDRPAYRLEMDLWEAEMEGEPETKGVYPEWRWAAVDLLSAGAAAGSLCCALAIQSKSRVSS